MQIIRAEGSFTDLAFFVWKGTEMTDVLLISPNNAAITYQSLAHRYSAIEPPTWALLIAESMRAAGFEPKIIDCLAEAVPDEEIVRRVIEMAPRAICFVVYGQNVNAGTTNMSGAVRLATAFKSAGIETLIGFVGSHVQALPEETLQKEPAIDYLFLNEGIYSMREMLAMDEIGVRDIETVNGFAVRIDDRIIFTGPPKVVAQAQLDDIMPGYAWDLLPYNETPLDLYRAPYWHAEYQDEFRSPYAALQTSIGCQFKCSFCMINLINKNDDTPESVASNYNGMRHWSVEFVERELTKLVEMGVKTIRITDEMFLLNKKFYRPIVDTLIRLNKNDDLKLWAYSRIDTVPSPEELAKVRRAGIRWLALGIESGDKAIRLEVAKGKFEAVDVEKIVEQVEAAGIHVMANYIYGLPGDTPKTIQETFDLSTKLNTVGWNTYAAMALPGSPLYMQAKKDGQHLPTNYEEFSFHSYETIPLSTEKMEASEILKMRDEKFTEYFGRSEFIERITQTFGSGAAENIIEMNSKRLRRKIIEEADRLPRQS